MISNLTIGLDTTLEEPAQWIAGSTEHVVVASVLPIAIEAGGRLETFVNKATVASLHESMLQHEGATAELKIISKARREHASTMNAAVAAAIADQFVLFAVA